MTSKESSEDDNDMMKNVIIKKPARKPFRTTINLSEIDGEGSFPCPKCGTMISPDDESDEVYNILDTKMVNGDLAELVISCCTCGTVIRLVGFEPSLGVPSEE